MRYRGSASLVTVAIAFMLVSLAVPVSGQTSSTASNTWTPDHTPDGQPDLQGIWTNETITAFERPIELADKAFLTQEEASELEARNAEQRAARDGTSRAGSVGIYNEFWRDPGTEVVETRQTSLIVDPPDGRIPVRPEAEARRDDNTARNTDSWEYMSVWDRCITRGVPGSMFPTSYNNAYQILQIPGYVVIRYEMIHDVRIIPVDERPHVGSDIGLWMGDSRGRWEGNTLVVETTNYNDRGWIAQAYAAGRIRGVEVSKAMRVVERFTRVDEQTINWEATVEDLNIYTKPWTLSMPLKSNPQYQMYEYACHEGNWAVRNALSGARVQEVAAAADATGEK